MSPSIRSYRTSDLDDLYRICLLTGAAGRDASLMYKDPKILGHVYAAPYGVLEPESAFVVEDSEGVAGYIVGARDTYAFEKRLERDWWPALRNALADPTGTPPSDFTPDQRMHFLIHHPPRTPRRISEPYPSHLHINLLPRLQGQRLGARLLDRWLEAMRAAGSRGAHLGVGEANARAIRFYRAYGLREIEKTRPPFNVYFFGIELNA